MTERQLNPQRSAAILIGIGEFQRQQLPIVPVVQSLDLMADTLHTLWGWTEKEQQIVRVENCSDLSLELREKSKLFNDLDTLLVYFCGHGLLNANGELFLALPHTDPYDRDCGSAVAFKRVFDLYQNSATHTVFILDCCRSGSAVLLGAKNRYSFLLAAAEPSEDAKNSLDKTQPTPFTAALCELLRHGDSALPEYLTLPALKSRLTQRLSVAPFHVAMPTEETLRLCQNPAFKQVSDKAIRAERAEKIRLLLLEFEKQDEAIAEIKTEVLAIAKKPLSELSPTELKKDELLSELLLRNSSYMAFIGKWYKLTFEIKLAEEQARQQKLDNEIAAQEKTIQKRLAREKKAQEKAIQEQLIREKEIQKN